MPEQHRHLVNKFGDIVNLQGGGIIVPRAQRVYLGRSAAAQNG